MKQTTRFFGLLSFLLCLPILQAWGNVIREKEEEVRFTNIKSGETLELNTKYVNINIRIWSKDEILLKSKTTVVAKNGKEAEEALNAYSIKHRKVGDIYQIHRVSNSKQTRVKQKTCKWTVYVPQDKLSLIIQNKYGNINLSPESYKCKNAKFQLDYCNIDIQELVTETPCQMDIEYGNINAKKLNRLNLDVEYGNANIGTLSQGTISIEYGNVNIKSLLQSLTCECEYSEFGVSISDAKSFSELTVNGKYGNIQLHVPQDIHTRYSLATTYGDVDVDVHRTVDTKMRGNHKNGFKSTETGYIGKNAKASIDIQAKYGNITLLRK